MYLRLSLVSKDNLWLENPSTFSRKNLNGPMTVIDSKLYVLGVSEEKDSKLALFELEPGQFIAYCASAGIKEQN